VGGAGPSACSARGRVLLPNSLIGGPAEGGVPRMQHKLTSLNLPTFFRPPSLRRSWGGFPAAWVRFLCRTQVVCSAGLGYALLGSKMPGLILGCSRRLSATFSSLHGRPRSLRPGRAPSSLSFGGQRPGSLRCLSGGPTALWFEAVLGRAAAPGARKGRERSCLAASRPDLIVPDPVGPLRAGRAGSGSCPRGLPISLPNG
jgi:hypothetical protein